MNYINYQIHKILQSNYKLLINIIILSLLSLCYYNQNISYCMNENNLEQIIIQTPTEMLEVIPTYEETLFRNITNCDNCKFVPIIIGTVIISTGITAYALYLLGLYLNK